MTTSTFIRWSGVAAILAGLSTLAGTILELNPIPALEMIYLISLVTTVLAVIGIYFFQRESAGLVSLLGAIGVIVGNLLFGPESTLLIGGLVFTVGLILLAIGAFQARKFPRWVPILWIVSPLIGIPGMFLPSLEVALFLVGAIALALAFIGAGYTMWRPASR